MDDLERLCQQRALKVYGLNSDKWGVNVQPHSGKFVYLMFREGYSQDTKGTYKLMFSLGSSANFAVYISVVEPNGRIMGLDPVDGGHHSHGYIMDKEKFSATSLFFESMHYKVLFICCSFVRLNYPDVCYMAKSI